MTRKVEGLIGILICRECGQASPRMIFVGDTDMATAGLVSLTSVAANEIVICEAEPAEWSDETGQRLEARINTALSRDDLRFLRLLCVEETVFPAGLSFQEFRKVYRAPRLTYSCPKCGVGEIVSDREITPSEYRSEGGQLTVLGELELCKQP